MQIFLDSGWEKLFSDVTDRGGAMQEHWRRAAAKCSVCLFVLLLPLPATAQPSAVGVVTGTQGRVELTRRPAPTPVPLQFKDELFLRDLIDTFERSMARMLFGGRSSVTVRELTRFEVRAEILPSGATRTVYDLVDGKIRVIVPPQLMRPGDEVEIRTPNAVAGIRGTDIVAERDSAKDRSQFTMLDDCASVTPRDKLPFNLCEGTRVAMTGSQVEPVQTITRQEAAQLQAEFDMGSSHPGEANRAQILETHVRTGEQLMAALVGIATEQTPAFQAETSTSGLLSDANTDRTPLDEDPSAVTPPPAPPAKNNVNIIVNPGFETGAFSLLPLPPTGFVSNTYISGWNVFNQLGSNGSFIIYDNATIALPFSGTTVPVPLPVPPVGTFAAVTDSAAPGSHILYQDVTVPVSGMLSFDLFIGNANAGGFVTPATLDYTGVANQQARVDLMDPAAPIQDIGAGVIQNLFQTNPGDPLVSGYNTFVFDVSALAGQNVRLRFAEVDNQAVFNFGVDNVSLIDPAFPGDLVLQGSGSRRTVFEPVFHLGTSFDVGTDPTVAGDLLDIRDGGLIVMNTADPVALFEGAMITVGTADTTEHDSPNRLFNVQGVNVDASTGLGTDQPILGNGIDPPAFPGATKPIGSLVEATDGTTIVVKSGAGDTAGGNALYLDTALLEASAPIIRLIGWATGQTSLKTDGSTIDLFKSKVAALGPIVALDNGLINVQNGPLIRLTDGSNMLVTGDLLSLINGSRINVLNGPLASVDGAGTLLDVSGALVNFGGTGGNQIVVNNNIAPTATLSGLPVSATTGGSVTIGPNPVKNPALGNISVNGSLISATQGGSVNIAAP